MKNLTQCVIIDIMYAHMHGKIYRGFVLVELKLFNIDATIWSIKCFCCCCKCIQFVPILNLFVHSSICYLKYVINNKIK